MADQPTTSLSARGSPLASSEVQLRTLRQLAPGCEFDGALQAADLPPLRPSRIDVFQMNLGKLCNQTCRHCHVDAGPDRREVMSRETMELCLAALHGTAIPTVDLTGGAPELNPHFRWLVEQLAAMDRHVMDRCNLTILETAPHHDLPAFLARHRVEVVCSLPHYRALSTDRQRGDGVHEKSIRALQRLNALGYGDGSSGLRLVLVTNPVGAFLPADQEALEALWRRELKRNHGIVFDALYTITNMPIGRFLEWLQQSGNLVAYLERLVAAFNPAAVPGVMCRNTLSIGWDGRLHDCDFNQMLDLGLDALAPQHVRDFDLARLEARRIVTDRHCFGCTAGAGSSCGGAVT
ncbi:MAG TPA: arsenosugar biosynthesis radical SAM (seleno)protein ArsS [Planctomycetota bacterium]|nr:arsenosugar biosynthesis radical SAM (seleno)protein ArsS [Planctomycetota bacterium]